MSDIAKMIAIAKKFGGGSSTPAPVVILPETELTLEDGEGLLTTPWEADMVAGGVYAVTIDGTAYECEAYTMPDGESMGVLMGNSDKLAELGITGGNADAPFVLIAAFNAVGPEAGMYGQLMVQTEAASVTLSIVQTEDAASGGNVGGGGELFVVNATTADGSTVTVDKTYDEIATAVSTKKFGICCLDLMGTQTLYLPFAVITQNTFVFSAHVPNIDAAVTVNSDGTSNLDFTMLT